MMSSRSPSRPPSSGTRRQAARPAAGLVALLAGLGLPPGRPAQAAAPYDWHLVRSGPAGQPVSSGTPVRLVNVTSDDALGYGAREYGINLVWLSPAGPGNVRFYKVGGGPLRYGDRLALWVEGGGFVRYGPRQYGIDLVWFGV